MHPRDANFRRLSMVRPERYGDDACGPGAAAYWAHRPCRNACHVMPDRPVANRELVGNIFVGEALPHPADNFVLEGGWPSARFLTVGGRGTLPKSRLALHSKARRFRLGPSVLEICIHAGQGKIWAGRRPLGQNKNAFMDYIGLNG